MKPKVELYSYTVDREGYIHVNFMLNDSSYKSYRFMGYTLKETLKLARARAMRDAEQELVFVNHPA